MQTSDTPETTPTLDRYVGEFCPIGRIHHHPFSAAAVSEDSPLNFERQVSHFATWQWPESAKHPRCFSGVRAKLPSLNLFEHFYCQIYCHLGVKSAQKGKNWLNSLEHAFNLLWLINILFWSIYNSSKDLKVENAEHVLCKLTFCHWTAPATYLQ